MHLFLASCSLLLVVPGHSQRLFDIYSSAILPFSPPFLCPNETRSRRRLQDGRPAIFDFKARQTQEDVNALLADSSPFSASSRVALADANGTIKKASLRSSSNDLSTLDTILKQIFFTGCTDSDTCQGGHFPAELGSETPLAGFAAEGILGSIVSLVGSSKLLVCAASKIFLNQNNPINIGVSTCDCATAVSQAEGQCAVIKVFSHAVGCSPYKDCPSTALPPLLDHAVGGLELALDATLPTPATMPKTIIQTELVTYYWLWQALGQLVYDTFESMCGQTVEPLALPGWNVEQSGFIVDIDLDGLPQRLPFARLQSRSNAVNNTLVDLLISIRGTATSSEWALDFSYNKVTFDSPLFGPTDLHRGFSAVATALLSPLRSTLDAYAESGQLGTVTLTGHSLGGGIGACLSFMLANQYPLTVNSLPGAPPRFRAVLFGAPLAGDEQFTKNLGSIVVLRTFTSEFDPIAHIPCKNIVSCSADEVPIPTGRNNIQKFTFSYYPGSIKVKRSDLPSAFSGKGTNLQLAAWHICAYSCWLTRSVTPLHPQQCFDVNFLGDQAAVCSYL